MLRFCPIESKDLRPAASSLRWIELCFCFCQSVCVVGLNRCRTFLFIHLEQKEREKDKRAESKSERKSESEAAEKRGEGERGRKPRHIWSGQAHTIPGAPLFECHVNHPFTLPFCPIHCLPPSLLSTPPCGLSVLELGGSPASIKTLFVP